MRSTTFSRDSIRWLFAELLIIILGILLAFQVDEWQAESDSQDKLRMHLLNVHTEISYNLRSLEITLNRLESGKIPGLDGTIRFLSTPALELGDATAQIAAIWQSMGPASPWLNRGAFDAFKSSESYAFISDDGLGARIADAYEAYPVIIGQVETYQGNYPSVIQSYMPASAQSRFSHVRGYTMDSSTDENPTAPRISDIQSPIAALEALHKDAGRLLPLARTESAVATGNWYAMTRTTTEFSVVLDRIETRLDATYPGWRDISQAPQLEN